jgi:hypothetical protein
MTFSKTPKPKRVSSHYLKNIGSPSYAERINRLSDNRGTSLSAYLAALAPEDRAQFEDSAAHVTKLHNKAR